MIAVLQKQNEDLKNEMTKKIEELQGEKTGVETKLKQEVENKIEVENKLAAETKEKEKMQSEAKEIANE